MQPGQTPDNRGPILFLVMLVMVGVIVIAGGLGGEFEDDPPQPPAPELTPRDEPSGEQSRHPKPRKPKKSKSASAAQTTAGIVELPGGGRRVFGHGRFLVAYYGTAGTGALGVLGETEPDEMHQLARRAARPFRHGERQVQVVYELIVTIADRGPGPDGDFSHDIDRASVERYVEAAHRNGALLLLDIQPGRTDFLTVAQRWAWALRHPWVGLALDPEWRVGERQVPAGLIGRVQAAEINRTSAWLARLTARQRLPQKLFVVHQFRAAMVSHIERVRQRPALAMVQHADGFGTRGEKLATYHALARPRQFTMGLKLFYDEDVRRFEAADVRRIRPRVSFVSYQ